MINDAKGQLFSEELQKKIKERFSHMDYDGGERRVFFENAGGALRLKESARRFAVRIPL